MRYLIYTFIFLQWATISNAQNVGVGTTTPATQLHVTNAAGSSIIRTETNTAVSQSAVELKTGTAPFDYLEMRKWIAGSGGSQAGIPLDGLSIITTGSNTTGGLLFGTKPAQPIYFTTNNTERMQINALGNVRIGNTDPGLHRLGITASEGSAIYAQTSFIAPVGQLSSSIYSTISNNSLRGAAVVGQTENALGSTSGIVNGMYGVVGAAVEQGYGIGAFGAAGAGGIYSYIFGSGKALRTFGGVQFEGLGAGLGKVLTSDAAGNATWQNISSSSHNHFDQSWSGDAGQSGLTIINNSTNSSADGITGISNGTNGTGISGSSSHDNGIGVSGIVFHDGVPFPPSELNSGVQGLNSTGTGIYASSMTGYALKAVKQNWTSVSGPVALLKNERTTNTSPVVLIQNSATNPTALELNNGYIKVSGANKMAFVHTTTAANNSGNTSLISYPNATSTDMLFVTHNYSPLNTYFNYNYGVYWTGGSWAVYIENTAINMPVNISFNVMVIKQ